MERTLYRIGTNLLFILKNLEVEIRSKFLKLRLGFPSFPGMITINLGNPKNNFRMIKYVITFAITKANTTLESFIYDIQSIYNQGILWPVNIPKFYRGCSGSNV